MFSWVFENVSCENANIESKIQLVTPNDLDTNFFLVVRFRVYAAGSQKLESDLGQPAAAEIIHIHEYE